MPKKPHNQNVYDFVIVGGGIAGLSSAYHLAKEGYSVALLDRDNCTKNASFNSTAITSHDPDAHWSEVTEKFGLEGARDIWKLSEISLKLLAGYAHVAHPRFIAKRLPAHIFSTTAELDEELAEQYELYKKLGARCTLSKDGSVLHKNFRSVLSVEQEGQSNNQAMLKTLVKMVRRHGGKIITKSPVTAIERTGSGVRVLTADTAIEGRHAIVATGEAELLPELAGKTTKKRTFVVAYDKKNIPKPFKNSVLWDIDEPYHYIRSFRGRTLWVGGADIEEKDYNPKKNYHADVERFAKDRLLFDSSFKKSGSWSGTFYPTAMGLPYISQVGDSPIYVSLGFGGTGILMSFLSGHLLASWVRGKETRYQKYFSLTR